jgi:hypothetical protein
MRGEGLPTRQRHEAVVMRIGGYAIECFARCAGADVPEHIQVLLGAGRGIDQRRLVGLFRVWRLPDPEGKEIAQLRIRIDPIQAIPEVPVVDGFIAREKVLVRRRENRQAAAGSLRHQGPAVDFQMWTFQVDIADEPVLLEPIVGAEPYQPVQFGGGAVRQPGVIVVSDVRLLR